MSCVTAGIHETAAQRALQILEILEIILDYTISPGINAPDEALQQRAWESSALGCRAVNKLWKQVYNNLLLSRFVREENCGRLKHRNLCSGYWPMIGCWHPRCRNLAALQKACHTQKRCSGLLRR